MTAAIERQLGRSDIAWLWSEAQYSRGPKAKIDRGASLYFAVFGYGENGDDARNKIILDVGAGESDFAKVCAQSGLATVVTLDPMYVLKPPIHRNLPTAGIAQELPFRDSVFDETVASNSLFWTTDRRHAFLFLSEMLRVTKEGGKVKIYPVFPIDSRYRYGYLPPHTSLIGPSNVKATGFAHTRKTLMLTKPSHMNRNEQHSLVKDILLTVEFTDYHGRYG